MTVAQRIRNIMAVSHKARNSDKTLWILYAQKSGVNLSPEQIEKIKQMPEFETLRRTRQMIQRSGTYPSDEIVRRARYSKASKVRQSIPFMEPEDAEKTLQGYTILPYGQ